MFTGLIQAIGVIKQVSGSPEGKSLTIHCPELIGDIAVDDSIAVNGVCLTAAERGPDGFIAHAIHTTLEKTTLGSLDPGQRVNLELAMRASDRLGGHLVQGHVNAIGRITGIDTQGNNWQIHISFPADLRKYMIAEGSITLDGISLTIAKLADSQILLPKVFRPFGAVVQGGGLLYSVVQASDFFTSEWNLVPISHWPALATSWWCTSTSWPAAISSLHISARMSCSWSVGATGK